MADKKYTSRVEEVKRRREEAKKASSGGRTTAEDIARKRLGRNFGIDTFDKDLREMGNTISNIYSGWQTQETMANTKASVEAMHERIGHYQTYQKRFGGADLTEVQSAYKTALDDWDKLSESYGYYQNADAYDKAVQKFKLDEQFSKKNEKGERIGLSYDEVQEQMKKYGEGTPEYEYLRNYTNYSDLKDFDKAIENASKNIDYTKDLPSFDKAEKEKLDLPKTNDILRDVKQKNVDDSFMDSFHEIAEQNKIDKAAEERVSELSRLKNQYKLDYGVTDYYSDYMKSEDFEELSKYSSTKKNSGWNTQYNMGYGDLVYEYINNAVDGIRDDIASKQFAWRVNKTFLDKGYNQLEPEEVQLYNYLHALDERDGSNLADKYLEDMEVAISKRMFSEQTQNWEKTAENPIGAVVGSMLTIPTNLYSSVMGTLETFKEGVEGKEYNPYGYYKSGTALSSDIRGYVGENIAEATEGMDVFGVNVPSFLYQTGMSIGDTTLGAVTLGSAYSVVAGTSAFQNKARELKEAGESEEVVFYGALGSGLAECLFEYFSIEKLINIKSVDGLRKAFTESLKQAGIEASEELATELANIMSDNFYRGENSDLEQLRQNYIERGFSKAEADEKVTEQIKRQLGEAFASGLVSGATMGSVKSAADYVVNKETGSMIRTNDRVQDMLDVTSKMTAEESEAYNLYNEYAKKGINSENIKNAQLGNLYNTTYGEANSTYHSRKASVEEKVDALSVLQGLDKVGTSKTEEEKARQKRVEELNKGESTEVKGKSVSIEGIKIEDGSTIVLTSQGEHKAEDVTFSSNEAELLSYAEIMGVEKGNLLIKNYDGTQNVDKYVTSFNMAYTYGEDGIGVDSAIKNSGVLTERQVANIYTTAIKQKAEIRQKAIDDITKKYSAITIKKGKFDDSIIDYTGKNTDGSKVNWNTLTTKQRNAIRFAKAFSKVTGVNIVFTKSEIKNGMHKGENGSYDPKTNTITLDVYAGRMEADTAVDAIIPTLSHEVTHWMKAKSPEMYAKLQEKVMNTLSLDGELTNDQRVDAEMARMKRSHNEQNVTEEDAIDELVARACEDMLSNSEKAREFLEGLSEKEKKSFLAKVEEVFNNLIEWVNNLMSQYKSDSDEAKFLRQYEKELKEAQKLWDETFADAVKVNQALQKADTTAEAAIKNALEQNGVLTNGENATVYSVRYLLDEKTKDKVASDLVKALGVSKDAAYRYLDAETSIASIVLNPKHQEFLDYGADENEVAIKKNSDYPQGTVDFSNICAKRRDFTSVMNRVMSKFKDHIFLSTDLAKIRTIMSDAKITIPCGICYVEDRRQLDSIVAEDFLKSIELYKNGSKIRPDGKPFNERQLKALKMIENDTYKPSIYELITLEGRNALKEKNAIMESAWVIFNNARGMQSIRLLTNEAEYKREILKYTKDVVKTKNDLGGLRIYSFSDAEIPHLIDLIQVITDSASKGLAIQGYTKVNWYAKMIKDTGVKINRSLIPAGDLGYHIENGKVVLDYDTVEGIDINDKDFFDSTKYDNVGNILIGINEVQIKAAMRDKFVDYIIPFHTGQSADVLKEKGIHKWHNYEKSQSERKISDGKKSAKQINIYTDVIQRAEAEGKPIENKVQFVEKFLSVCKENGLIPRFSEFLNTDENGDYIYTEGYHKLIIDFKTFHPITGEYLPQKPVKPNFDIDFITQTLNDFVKQEKIKQAELQPKMDKAIARIEKEVIKKQYSDRDPDYIDSRTLLTNALESVATTDDEKTLLAEYRKNIDLIGIKESELSEITTRINELSSVVGNKDKQQIDHLRKRAERLRNSISYYDKQLLKLEATEHLKNLVYRERSKARRKAVSSYKENLEKRAEIENITQKALTLRKWMVTNSKDEHIPKAMRPVVKHLIDAIDFSSKQLLGMRGGQNQGMPTKADISLSKALADIKNIMANTEVDGDVLYELYGSDLDADMGKLVDSVNDHMREVGDNAYILNKMTLDELKKLNKVVGAIKTSVRKMNQFHVANTKKSIASVSQGDMSFMDSLGPAKLKSTKFGKGISQMLNWGNATPYYVFKRFGKGGELIYEALMDGWDKFAFRIKEIIDFGEKTYKANELKEWSEEVKEFEVLLPATKEEMEDPQFKGNTQKVKITTAQIMSLYCLQKREQGKGHIFGGGIRITDIETNNGVISQTDGIVLTEEELNKIIGSLTSRQIAVADALQKFMGKDCAEWGNEISMKRFGYEAFGEENYFPIRSDENVTGTDEVREKEKTLYRLLNMSFTKALTQNANNRIFVDNIFDVFAQHTSEMAKYNALALPVLDAVRWYNYKEKGPKVDGRFKTVGIKQSMEKAYGNDAKNYVNTFLKDLNGSENVGRDNLARGFMSNAKIASVGFNVKVMALQPTSFLRASAVIDNKYLAAGLLRKPKYKMAEKWCGMAQWKGLGFIDINVQRGVTELIKNDKSKMDKVKEASMKGAELFDQITLGYLWNACELEVRDTRSDLEKGTDEYFEAVGKKLREVIYSTQVVDSTMTRSHMMRSPDTKDKILTNFASEPTLSYNMLMDAYFSWKITERQTGSKSTAFKKHGKKLARTMYAYTITSVITALIETGFGAFRDDDEKDEEELIKMYLENLWSNMSILNKIPYLKEGISILQGFTSTSMDTHWMQYFAYTIKGVAKLLEGEGNAYTTAKNGIKALSYLSGIPGYNIIRDINATLNKAGFLTTDEQEELFNDTIGDIFPSLKIK